MMSFLFFCQKSDYYISVNLDDGQENASNIGYGISPIMYLTLILIIYLGTLLTYRKKYGD
ncbi:hypothetical protein E3U55_12340 [Filobacillus milosensis]|uniref:Uncharacterized protein n=1 Tax=Filobacillus milosensis TaxID=94137 RepID=A0A4Y8IH79_9BACI|nr:hypothetical protein E3U55_12340 [Filobacillus milosensis]